MQRWVLKSKIHGIAVTRTNLEYQGSITLSLKILKSANIVPYEQVHILNVHTGERFATYVIPSEEEGVCEINGAAARLVQIGDRLLVLSYALLDESEIASFETALVFVEKEDNRKYQVVKKRLGIPGE